jgi:hypothetical protein
MNYTNNTKEVFTEIDMEYVPRKTKLEVTAKSLSVALRDGTCSVEVCH